MVVGILAQSMVSLFSNLKAGSEAGVERGYQA